MPRPSVGAGLSSPAMHRTVAAGAVVLGISLIAAACSGDDDSSSDTSASPPSTQSGAARESDDAEALSMVVIGDSVAAGEGIAYGYSYYYDSDFPNYSYWTGGVDDPTWQGEYQLCHQDTKAYGEAVAAALGAKLAKFACTGATYLNGITVQQTESDGTVMRPAQFGDWSTKSDLNPAYDAAAPDVVVLTFGADDVSFVPIVTYCVTGYTLDDADTVQALADAEDTVEAIEAGFADVVDDIKAEIEGNDTSRRDDSDSSYCTEENPGAPIEKLFWEPINSGEVAQHYKDIVTAIQERGKDPDYGNGKVPKIVFTTYHRPMPADLDGDCWDVYPLSGAEQSYLQSLQDTLQTTLEDAVAGLEGVSIADISNSIDGHEWCTEDPWAYGLSVLTRDADPESQAPFHPTPDGQAAIAAIVQKSVAAAVGEG